MNERRSTRAGAAALVLLALLAGACSSPERGAGTVDAVPPAQPGTARVADPAVERWIETRLHGLERRDGRLVVDLHVLCTSAEPLEVLWSVEWYDREGRRLVDPAATWAPLAVVPGGTARVELLAPSPTAESWRFRASRAD